MLAFILTTLWFTVGGTISAPAAWGILGASLAGGLYLPRLFLSGSWRFAPLASVALIIAALIVTGLVHDTSIDGQHYHFQAIYALAEGWNPVHGNSEPAVIGDPITLWAIHYPRSGWDFAALLMAAGLPLAMGKVLNLLALFAGAALLAGALFRFGFSWLFAALLTAVAVLNPIVLSQLFTAMNDGLVGLCILIFTVSMMMWARYDNKLALAAGLAAMVLALNLKFSAIPMFVILCAFACAGIFFARGLRPAMGLATTLFASAIMAIVVLGWSPYMQNFLDHGHVFHPIMGQNAVDIMSGDVPALNNTPEVLEGMSAAERFLYSLFSETHSGYAATPQLKLPFSISPQELRAAGGVDVRLSGFGPFFSGIFLLSIAGAAALIARPRWRSSATLCLLLISAVMMFSVVVMPQNWWARYVPQFWFVPMGIAAAALAANSRAMQTLGGLIAAVMLLNAVIVGAAGLWLTANRGAEATAQINIMAASGETYCVYPDMVQSRIYLMREARLDIRYQPAEAIACAEPQEISGYGPDRFGGAICACQK
ncbi:MAG: hypothetical protein CVT79_13385 [Alphaproteobacteria bacterium HGW-Alphaproteobacteria-18]|nr:MAG: hypothetical protein CVT79_13385 [Alphaproteobacteria bacterium HGW-Alphaproteobacteria-18]